MERFDGKRWREECMKEMAAILLQGGERGGKVPRLKSDVSAAGGAAEILDLTLDSDDDDDMVDVTELRGSEDVVILEAAPRPDSDAKASLLRAVVPALIRLKCAVIAQRETVVKSRSKGGGKARGKGRGRGGFAKGEAALWDQLRLNTWRRCPFLVCWVQVHPPPPPHLSRSRMGECPHSSSSEEDSSAGCQSRRITSWY
jgi:hypothetical protein